MARNLPPYEPMIDNDYHNNEVEFLKRFAIFFSIIWIIAISGISYMWVESYGYSISEVIVWWLVIHGSVGAILAGAVWVVKAS